jgi:hypothetical protein
VHLKPIRLGGTHLSRVGTTLLKRQSLSLYRRLLRIKIFLLHSSSPILEVVRFNPLSIECSVILRLVELAQFVDNRVVSHITPDTLRAPESIMQGPWDSKVDIWTFGCLVSHTSHSCLPYPSSAYAYTSWVNGFRSMSSCSVYQSFHASILRWHQMIITWLK